MKIIIVHIGDVLLCPPVLNLINMLEQLEVETKIITTRSISFNSNKYKYVEDFQLEINYEEPRKLVKKFLNLFSIRKELWNKIDNFYQKEDIIWVTSNLSLKHLGNRVTKKNFVLQLMELSEELIYYKYLPFIKMNKTKIGNSALAVVVPEYNRAHITKVWWNLDNIPLILSNKPYIQEKFKVNSEIHDSKANEIIKSIEKRKIILYQGIMHKERPLDKYIHAVDKLGDDYAFVVMSSGENIYENIKSNNYFFIPYVKPPKHLEITSHAYIGVLSYFPVKSRYSILNALYCAPNKTFEYAMFNVPMIGNDIPGLKYLFDTTNSGLCVENFEIDTICEAIRNIETNHDEMGRNARIYYDSIDTEKQLIEILFKVKERIKKNES